ncbi:hypothetical protein LTR94_037768, partial [Friedmanniomyces endolithicus]
RPRRRRRSRLRRGGPGSARPGAAFVRGLGRDPHPDLHLLGPGGARRRPGRTHRRGAGAHRRQGLGRRRPGGRHRRLGPGT